MKRKCSGHDVPDMTLQKEKEDLKFKFISEEIIMHETLFRALTKLLFSETPFSKNSYCTETSQIICNAKQLAGFQTIRVFSERHFQTDISPFPANVPFKQTRQLVFTSKMF